jgi:ATP-dependent Lon protease
MAEKRPGELAILSPGHYARFSDRQKILEQLNPIKRLETLCVLLERESKLLKLEEDIHAQVQETIRPEPREYYLREQLKAISGNLTRVVRAKAMPRTTVSR